MGGYRLCSILSLCFAHTQTYARPDATAAGHAQYAANVTGKILKFFEGHFGIDYEQQKLCKPFSRSDWMDVWVDVKYGLARTCVHCVTFLYLI